MNNADKTVVLVTGASSGIGRACANRLAQNGYTVYGTSRNAAKLADSAFHPLSMDVNDEQSVQQAIATILEKEQRLDVVVNNAGIAMNGALEETSIDEAKAIFETNVFGVHRMIRAVLPQMRQQKGGKIINISSIAGQFGLPYRSIYSASKSAMSAMIEALQYEVESFNVQLVIIEPGDVKTEINEHRTVTKESGALKVYDKPFAAINKMVSEGVNDGITPEQLAAFVEKTIRNKSPKLRYQVGPTIQKLAVVANHIVPASFFKWIIKTNHKL